MKFSMWLLKLAMNMHFSVLYRQSMNATSGRPQFSSPCPAPAC